MSINDADFKQHDDEILNRNNERNIDDETLNRNNRKNRFDNLLVIFNNTAFKELIIYVSVFLISMSLFAVEIILETKFSIHTQFLDKLMEILSTANMILFLVFNVKEFTLKFSSSALRAYCELILDVCIIGVISGLVYELKEVCGYAQTIWITMTT